MKHYEVFEKCKDLVLRYGYKRERGNSLYSYYTDGFGVGLQVDYHCQVAKINADDSQTCINESIGVYLGGRELYTYTKEHDKEFYYDSDWYDLVVELLYIELKTGLEESVYVNKNVLDFYRMEAEKNRRIFSDFTAVCVDVAKTRGVLDDNFRDTCCFYYKFLTQVDEKELKLYFKDSLINKDIEVRYDGKIIFSYCWDQFYDTGIEQKGYFDLSYAAKLKRTLDSCRL